MNETRMDECLSNRDGVLFVEQVASPDLIEQFGSPLFVFSEDQIRRNVRRFRAAFEKGWTAGHVKVMPAAKANWLFAVQRVLADEGCGADIYSAGELDVALRAGVDPQFISANGVPKDREHIRRTIEVGARLTIGGLPRTPWAAPSFHALLSSSQGARFMETLECTSRPSKLPNG